MNIFKITSVNDAIYWFMLGYYITTWMINEIWESFLKKLIKSDIYSDAGLLKKTRSKNRLLGYIIFVLYLIVLELIDCTNIVDACSNIKILKTIINDTSDVVFLFIWMGQIFGYIINSIWYRSAGKMLMSQFDIEQDSIYNGLKYRQTKVFILLELVITCVAFIFIGINETIDYSKFIG